MRRFFIDSIHLFKLYLVYIFLFVCTRPTVTNADNAYSSANRGNDNSSANLRTGRVIEYSEIGKPLTKTRISYSYELKMYSSFLFDDNRLRTIIPKGSHLVMISCDKGRIVVIPNDKFSITIIQALLDAESDKGRIGLKTKAAICKFTHSWRGGDCFLYFENRK